MRLYHEELSSDFDHLERTLTAIDRMIFDDDPEDGLIALCKLNCDNELKSECLRWRQRFSLPDALEVKDKW